MDFCVRRIPIQGIFRVQSLLRHLWKLLYQLLLDLLKMILSASPEKLEHEYRYLGGCLQISKLTLFPSVDRHILG
jgi:hypothetical protein